MNKYISLIVLGVVLLLAGSFGGPYITIKHLLHDKNYSIQFEIPGKISAKPDQAGRYYLWDNYYAIIDGTTYNKSKELPDGINIKITNSKSGKPFQFIANTSMSVNGSNGSKKSIGYITITEPCSLDIEVSGFAEKRIFSFSRARFSEILKYIFTAIGILGASSIAGLFLIIFGIIKLSAKKEKENQSVFSEPV